VLLAGQYATWVDVKTTEVPVFQRNNLQTVRSTSSRFCIRAEVRFRTNNTHHITDLLTLFKRVFVSYFTMTSVAGQYGVRMIDGEVMEGRGLNLIDVISWHLHGGIEGNHG
jgi:hypothetical protein